MSKKHKKVYRVLNDIDHLLTYLHLLDVFPFFSWYSNRNFEFFNWTKNFCNNFKNAVYANN